MTSKRIDIGTRVPAKQGVPLRIRGSILMGFINGILLCDGKAGDENQRLSLTCGLLAAILSSAAHDHRRADRSNRERHRRLWHWLKLDDVSAHGAARVGLRVIP